MNRSNEVLHQGSRTQANGSSKKRLWFLLAGGSATAFGLARRGWLGSLAAASGGYLVYRAAASKQPFQNSFVVSQTINRAQEEIRDFLRDYQHWPRFADMTREAVAQRLGQPSASEPHEEDGGWEEMEIVEGPSDNILRWRCSGPDAAYEITADFAPAPGNRGTEVRYRVSSSGLTSPVHKLLKVSAGLTLVQLAREHLRMIKELMEAGEIPTTQGQPTGARGLRGRGMRIMLRESVDDRRRPQPVPPAPHPHAAAS